MVHFRSQHGLAVATLLLLVVLGVVALILGRGGLKFEPDLNRREATTAAMTRVSRALIEYASVNKRLPCPALGNLDSGEANPESATEACTTPDGVVPWKTLGMRRGEAIDGWGRKLSYRVFSGPVGFTKTGGLDMTNCNSSLGAPIDPNLASGEFCKTGSPPPNSPNQFVSKRAPMLVVQDMATTQYDIAFVLISHGETGYGAYLAEGATTRLTLPSSDAEDKNTKALGTYSILARSSRETSPSDASHFDDIVTYSSLLDLATNARLGARPWSNYALSSEFSTANVEAAAIGFDSGISEDTNLTSLSMGGFVITATASGAQRNIGFREQSSTGGIGVVGGSSSSGDINSAFGEMLTFQLGTGSEFGKMDVALNAFQITDNIPLQEERAEISFWKGGAVVQTTTIDAWDDQDNPSECSFRLVSGQSFDRMDVAALSQTNSGGSTRFTVAGVKACSDSDTSCDSLSGADRCPIPPPSVLSGTATGINKTTATLQGIVEDNGVSIGTGTGYITSAFTSDSIGNNLIDLTSGSGTILAGNCLTIQGDGNTYVVETGIAAPGTIRIADPGLFQAIPLFSPRIVTLTPCITSTRFDFGTTLGYGSTVTASPATINAGSGSTCITATVTGLTCGTTYYYRARAANLANTTIHTSITTGSNSSFSTAACSAVEPGANSLGATNIGTSTARLNGTVNDNGMLTTVTFEYGLTPCYGSSVAAAPATLNAGTGSTAVLADLTGLSCNTYYYYRVVAANSTATTAGNATLFQTAACP